jgi:hypothetical protein
MTAKPDLNRISAERIAAADRVSRRRRDKPGRDLITDHTPITHLPSYPMRNEEEILEALVLTAEEEQRARRAVARFTMLRPHRCAGKTCRRRAHLAARAERDRFLMMLGLMPYESGDGRHYVWGKAAAGEAQ